MIDDEPDLEPDLAPDLRPRGGGKKNLARLDRTLDRIRRRKGGGGFWALLRNLVLLALLGSVSWALLYRLILAPETVLMVQRALEGQSIAHTPVKLGDISPHLVRAVIAAEDSKFCRHNGFDMEAIDAALKANERAAARGRAKLRGGSTISQQTAKNLFLWPHRDWVRKGAETYFTVLTELAWPKRRIMEQYLNAVEWGGGRFGAEAASQAYFGKSAKNLTAYEAARLAAVLPSPNKWSVTRPGPYVRARAASIMARMWVVHDQRLDDCVLGPSAPPPPRPAGKLPPPELSPLPEPPPAAAADGDQPVAQASPAPDIDTDEMTTTEPVSPEPPEEPELPSDAPAASGKPAQAQSGAPPVAAAPPSDPSAAGPLNIAP